MNEIDDSSLDKQIRRIMAKATPTQDHANLELYLANVRFFIQNARGEAIAKSGQIPPAHPLISFSSHLESSPELADFFERRLDLIERYEVTDVSRIIDILNSFSYLPPYPAEIRLSPRKVRILIELYKTPLTSNSQLATKLDSTPRTIRKELEELRRYFGFTFSNFFDYHKFKLAHLFITFRTKSITHSKNMVQLFQRSRPLFLHAFTFDEDFRAGFLSYTIPDQPKGHQLFEKRIALLETEYFQECSVARTLETYYSMSFDAYDIKSDSWICDSPLVSEAMLRFIQSHGYSIPPPHGIKYSAPMNFTQVDYLLAQLARNHVRPLNIDFIQTQLKKRGFNLAKKTIWAKLLHFRKEAVHLPLVYYESPSFESFVTLRIHCTSDKRDQIMLLPSILPYAFISVQESSVLISFHQPRRCGSITGQLVRALSDDLGVKDIEVIHQCDNIGSPLGIEAYDRWDESRQRWLIQEGDI